MSTPQSYHTIEPEQLCAAVLQLRDAGWRLVQIGATRLPEHVELTYSFDRALVLTNLRLLVSAPGGRVPSVSGIFWCAFLYENEIHDLFEIQVDGLAVDFHGALYQTAIPFPFSVAPKAKTPAARPSAAVADQTTAAPPDAAAVEPGA